MSTVQAVGKQLPNLGHQGYSQFSHDYSQLRPQLQTSHREVTNLTEARRIANRIEGSLFIVQPQVHNTPKRHPPQAFDEAEVSWVSRRCLAGSDGADLP